MSRDLVPIEDANVLPPFNAARGDILPLGSRGETRLLVETVNMNWHEGKKGQRIKITIEGVQV